MLDILNGDVLITVFVINQHIMPLIPPHRLYTEAFCGGASVLFAKRPAECEVINDLNRGLVNFYLVAKQIHLPLKSITLNLANVHIYESNLDRTRHLLAGGENVRFELNV